ncbi:terminase small subunit [Streptomyces sp. BBFR109]|uniref:terminase small subunit n=1 Tax=Streptomyces sp. BBFR109 TaxID=3448172 RepID=UPI003F75CB40
MARPTKLTETVLNAAREYVDTGWKKKKHAVPMIEGLALWIGVDRTTVREWADNPPTEKNQNETEKAFKARLSLHRRFSLIVNELNDVQAVELASGALKNKLNARTANMMLSKHGYVERKETDLTSQGKELKGATIVFSDEPASED